MKEGDGMYLPNITGVYHIHPGGICSMVPKADNAIHAYNCYKEIYLYNKDEVSRKLYVHSIYERLRHPKRRIKSSSLILEVWSVCRTRERCRLLFYYIVPFFIIRKAISMIRACLFTLSSKLHH